MDNKKYLTAESVTEGHPDKLCDLIADRILDACLCKDKFSRVACEVLATIGRIIVAGEITSKARINIRRIVRSVLTSVGYNPNMYFITVLIHKQSKDIAAGVDTALESRNEKGRMFSSIGAGDQGIVYGFATNETPEFLPLPLVLAHRITKRLAQVRKEKLVPGLLPDGKAQVTIEYENDMPKRVNTIIVSTQHEKNKSQEELRKDILQFVIKNVFKDFPIDNETQILVNPSGRFVLGGPEADTGLTGRKIMVDSYGGLASNGGGAFSGKDPTKVDRSGAYMARYIAKNIVAAGLSNKCELSIAYAIGKVQPVAVDLNSFGTGTVSDSVVRDAIMEVFDLQPQAIIRKLELRAPIFAATAINGHFSDHSYQWEQIDKTNELVKAVKEIVNRKDTNK